MSVYRTSSSSRKKAQDGVPGARPTRPGKDGAALWRRSWTVAAVATISFAVTSGFIWRGVEVARQDSIFVAEAAPMLGDIAEMKGMVSAEALRLAYLPQHVTSAAHSESLRRIRARRFRIAERAGALSDLMTDRVFGPRLSRAARVWWQPQGDGAAAEVARLLEASAAIGRSLRPDASSVAGLGVLADQLGNQELNSLGARLSAFTEEGRRITSRLAAEQETTLSRAGYLFLVALALYAALMMLFVMRPLVRRVVTESEDAATARYAADEKARARQDFMGAISHELRTPLNAILGSAELLADRAVGTEGRPHVETIRSNAETLKRQIDDMLRLAGADRDSAAADLTVTFDPREHAVQTLQMVEARARAKGLDLGLCLDPALPTTSEGDSAAIRKVLLTLLDNAVKFTAEGGVALRVSRAETPLGLEDGDRIRLRYEVIDSGPGVPEESRERIFDPFEQGHSGSDRPANGAGIGLALARDMARAMGGEIRVKNTEISGSTFCLDVLVDASADSQPGDLGQRSLAGLPMVFLGGDTPASAVRVEQLEKAGATVAFAPNAEAAVSAFTAEVNEIAARVLVVHDAVGAETIDAIAEQLDGAEVIALRLGDEDTMPDTEALGFFAYPVLPPADPRDWAERIQDTLVEGAGTRRSNSRRPLVSVEGGARAEETVRIDADTQAPRILVVDDEPANRRVMSLAFTRAGFTVDEASSGGEALELARSQAYALVTLDYRMDDMDGIETARRLRSLGSQSSRAALLIVTAEPNSIQRGEAEMLGVRAVVAKPVNLAALVALAKQEVPAADAA